MPPAFGSGSRRAAWRLPALLIAGTLVATLAPVAGEVADTPDWQWVTDIPPAAADSVDEVIYVGGGFNYIGAAIDDAQSFVGAGTGTLSEECATRTGPETGRRPTVVADSSGGLFMQVPAWPDEMFDGAGPFEVPPGESFVRIGADCRFDRTFRLDAFVPGDTTTRGLTIARVGDTVYVGGSRHNGFADQYGYLLAFNVVTRQRQDIPLTMFDAVLIEGATSSGLLVVSVPARGNTSGAVPVGLFNPVNASFNQVATVALDDGFVKVAGSTLFVNRVAGSALEAFDLATGQPKAGWSNPVVSVTDLEVGDGRVFVAGGGLGRTGVFALSESTGALIEAFVPAVAAPAGLTLSVERLALVGARLFVRGRTVRRADSAERYLLAAVDTSTGAADAWAPMVFAPTNTGIDLLPNGEWLYIGRVSSGELHRRRHLAAVDSVTGEVLAFDPSRLASPAIAPVTALAANGDVLFAATTEGQIRRVGLAMGQADAWGVRVTAAGFANGRIEALAATNATLYAGGYFDAAATSAQPQSAARGHGLAVDIASAQLTAWNPGVVSPSVSPEGGARPIAALALLENAVVVGGHFTAIGGADRVGLAAVDAVTAAVLAPGVPLDPGTIVLDLAAAPEGIYFVGRQGEAPVIGVAGALTGTVTLWLVPDAEDEHPGPRIAYVDGLVYSGPEWDPDGEEPTGSATRWIHPAPTTLGLLELRDSTDGETGPNRIRLHTMDGAVDPGAPRDLTARYSGMTVSLSWSEPLLGDVESYVVRAGPAPGLSSFADIDTGSTVTSLLASAPEGVYYVRVHARRAEGLSAASNEVVFALAPNGCNSPPAAPGALSGTGLAAGAVLDWGTAIGATAYVVEAGSAPSLVDLGRISVGARRHYATAAPPGIYYARVRGTNWCGAGPASNEIDLRVGGPPPDPPTNLEFSVSGSTVTLWWAAPAGGSPPAYYRLEAGSSPGQANLAATVTAGTSLTVPRAPAGAYYVRVRAGNPNGFGLPTPDVLIAVPEDIGSPFVLPRRRTGRF